MSERYEPLYPWRRTKLDENDDPRDTDWSGYDGEVSIGRIQKQPHGPMKDQWLWSGHGPHVRERLVPHQGYEAEGREAMRKVEEYYHLLMRHNKMRGSQDVD